MCVHVCIYVYGTRLVLAFHDHRAYSPHSVHHYQNDKDCVMCKRATLTGEGDSGGVCGGCRNAIWLDDATVRAFFVSTLHALPPNN